MNIAGACNYYFFLTKWFLEPDCLVIVMWLTSYLLEIAAAYLGAFKSVPQAH